MQYSNWIYGYTISAYAMLVRKWSADITPISYRVPQTLSIIPLIINYLLIIINLLIINYLFIPYLWLPFVDGNPTLFFKIWNRKFDVSSKSDVEARGYEKLLLHNYLTSLRIKYITFWITTPRRRIFLFSLKKIAFLCF